MDSTNVSVLAGIAQQPIVAQHQHATEFARNTMAPRLLDNGCVGAGWQQGSASLELPAEPRSEGATGASTDRRRRLLNHGSEERRNDGENGTAMRNHNF